MSQHLYSVFDVALYLFSVFLSQSLSVSFSLAFFLSFSLSQTLSLSLSFSLDHCIFISVSLLHFTLAFASLIKLVACSWSSYLYPLYSMFFFGTKVFVPMIHLKFSQISQSYLKIFFWLENLIKYTYNILNRM